MQTTRPRTLAECFTWLEDNLTEKQLRELKELSREDLWQTHFTIDKIVEERLLKGNDALMQNFDSSAFCGNPDLAAHVTSAFWDFLQIRG